LCSFAVAGVVAVASAAGVHRSAVV
jgi:hypothetical protein